MKDMKDSKPTKELYGTDGKVVVSTVKDFFESRGVPFVDSKPVEEVYEPEDRAVTYEEVEEILATKYPSFKEIREKDMKGAMDIVSECLKEALEKKAAEEDKKEAEERKEFNIFERYTRAVKNLNIVHKDSSKAAIFVGNYMYTEGQEYTETQIVNYINQEVLPWAFLNGIEFNASIEWKPTKTVDYNRVTAEYLYTENIPIVNYAMACMTAAKEHCRLGKRKITAIFYNCDAGKTTVAEYDDTASFTNDVREELAYLELAYLEATDKDE